jgi:Ca2+-transporting ATPase
LQDNEVQSYDWYSLETNEALQRLETSASGLTTDDVQQRLSKHGFNTFPEVKRRSLLMILLGQFSDFMIVVLLVAAVISGFIGEPQDTIAILVIVMLNAIIGAVQEFRAERAVAGRSSLGAKSCPRYQFLSLKSVNYARIDAGPSG